MYGCPFCKYTTKRKYNLKLHFNKKRKCNDVLIDLSPYQIDMLSENPTNISNIIQNSRLNNSQTIHEYKPLTNSNINVSYSSYNHSKDDIINSIGINNNNMNTTTMQHICSLCYNKFNTIEEYILHMSSCSNTDINNTENELIASLKALVLSKDETIKSLQKQIDKLIDKVGTHTTYQQNIILNPHGNENLDYLKQEILPKLIKNFGINSIPMLIRNLHFHKDHPENHNIKITNKKLNYAEVFNGKTWELQDRKFVTNSLVQKGLNLVDKTIPLIKEDDKQRIQERKTSFSQNEEIIKAIKSKVDIEVINGTKILATIPDK